MKAKNRFCLILHMVGRLNYLQLSSNPFYHRLLAIQALLLLAGFCMQAAQLTWFMIHFNQFQLHTDQETVDRDFFEAYLVEGVKWEEKDLIRGFV